MSYANYVTHSQCRIQFVPTDQKTSERNFSDRSIIELRQDESYRYALRALDIEDNRKEIFTIPFKNEGQYKCGKTVNNPDEIRSSNGTYRLWLNAGTRTKFQEVICTCIEEIKLFDDAPSSPGAIPKENPSRRSDPSPPRTPTRKTNPNRNEILDNVYQLGQSIRQGDTNEAIDLTRKLAQQHIQLQANPWTPKKDEQKMPIRIKIDSNDQNISRRNTELEMNVYPSTTIRELRTAFEYSDQFPAANQYFFVNGHLAHEASTMSELEVRRNSLFVLFLIQQ